MGDQKQPTYATDFVKADVDKAVYLDSLYADNLVNAFVELSGEFWVMRKRMLVLETLLAEGRSIDLAKLEGFMPTLEQKAAWDAQRDDFIGRVLGALTREGGKLSMTTPAATVPPHAP